MERFPNKGLPRADCESVAIVKLTNDDTAMMRVRSAWTRAALPVLKHIEALRML